MLSSFAQDFFPDPHIKNVWKYEIGDKLICEREENNPNDKFSVKLVLQRGNPGQCVGHVLNMDETPVWFEMPGKSTLAERGEKEVRVANFVFPHIFIDMVTPDRTIKIKIIFHRFSRRLSNTFIRIYINWIVLFVDNNETTDTRVKFYCLFH
jgi:hypothetical protein